MNVLRLITDFIKMSKVWFLSMEFYGVWQEVASAQRSTKMTPFSGVDVNQPEQQPDSEEDMQQKVEALITMKTKVEDLVDKNIKVM